MASSHGIDSLCSALKWGFHGTALLFNKNYIDRFFDEFLFRLNGGNLKSHTMERIDALFDKANGNRLNYQELINA